MSDIRMDTPRVADLLANLCDRGDDRFGAMTDLAQQLERELAKAASSLSDATNRRERAEAMLRDLQTAHAVKAAPELNAMIGRFLEYNADPQGYAKGKS